MVETTFRTVVQQLRRLAGGKEDRHLSDRELLQRFGTSRDEDAFAVLVERHAGLVFGVAWRVLRHAADAEDVFQATFLVLARKAATVAWQDSIGSWLYEVAYRLATKLRTETASRRSRERQGEPIERIETRHAAGLEELCRVLDEELQRLPPPCREPLLLCYLQGL